MVEFPWIPVPTDSGINYLPMGEIEIQSRSGDWLTFGFKLDSGADMTLMQEQDCYTLGYAVKDCVKRNYSNANSAGHIGYVRDFNIKIGDNIINGVPIAFSKKPIRVLLLGRKKIFDQLEMCFDGVNKRTILRDVGKR
jgi:hypothetical protein